MIFLLQLRTPWYEIGANMATMVGVLGLVFLIVEYQTNKNVRNVQLMHRCIDSFRQWSLKTMPKVDFFYLELLNEEFFYFQKGMIQRKVSIEWVEGILDFIQVKGKDGIVLNNYNNQTDLETVPEWQGKQMFFARIQYFIETGLSKEFVIPSLENPKHREKKRELAIELHNHIKRYKY